MTRRRRRRRIRQAQWTHVNEALVGNSSNYLNLWDLVSMASLWCGVSAMRRTRFWDALKRTDMSSLSRTFGYPYNVVYDLPPQLGGLR